MKIIVKAKPGAKEDLVEKVTQPVLGFSIDKNIPDIYRVMVKEIPHSGRANEAIIRVLAEYFSVSRSQVRIVSGVRSKQKIFEIGY